MSLGLRLSQGEWWSLSGITGSTMLNAVFLTGSVCVCGVLSDVPNHSGAFSILYQRKDTVK